MNWRLTLLRPLSYPVKGKVLNHLFRITAEVFQEEEKRFKELSYNKRLILFASYSSKLACKALEEDRDINNIKAGLYKRAFRPGCLLRRKLKLRKMAEAMKAAAIFYDMIGIRFTGSNRGEITIKECLFSKYYDSRVCDIMSALDRGIVSGLTAGGELKFKQRITEGHSCCKAIISAGDGTR